MLNSLRIIFRDAQRWTFPDVPFRSHRTSWRTCLRLPVIWSDLEMNLLNERTTEEEIDIKVVRADEVRVDVAQPDACGGACYGRIET